ncbi:MAG: cupin domain-containing protein [Elusimicrobia bacterium]|nr:cupin domain-containing protein [Elusimicrobiota bacterium]
MIFSLAKDRQWNPTVYEGIAFCWLWRNDAGGGTALLKLARGSSFPFHKHPGWEQIFLIEGSVEYCSQILGPGDHVFAGPGEVHRLVALQEAVFLGVVERDGVEVVSAVA